MKSNLNFSGLRLKLFRYLYAKFPFNIKADLDKLLPSTDRKPIISCLVCASYRPTELENLLFDLSSQTLDKSRFEVVILNDGGGDTIRAVVERYKANFQLTYAENPASKKYIGHLRNMTVSMSSGEYLLFLDDDTRILQTDFLEKALTLFKEKNTDIIVPCGKSLYGILKLKYDGFDSYSFGNAGCLYKRDAIEKVGGFRNDLSAYEDIEIGIRLSLINASMIPTKDLIYMHPPFYFPSIRKPIAVGQSVLQLRRKYPFILWLLIYLNAMRFLPLIFCPTQENRQWFLISFGVLIAPFTKRSYYY